MLWKLPVVFIIENNNYAMGTSVQRTTNVHDLYKIGLSYDMPSKAVDGMSVEDVHDAMVWAVDRARKGEGPSLLEMKTYRFRGHSMSDPGKYRTKEEVESYKSQDPIEQVLETLRKNKWITEAEIEATEERVKAVVEESVVFAEESPYPTADELYKDVYVQDNYPYILD
jgi:pyruvate dehydrogenase E1 component alpha subunit